MNTVGEDTYIDLTVSVQDCVATDGITDTFAGNNDCQNTNNQKKGKKKLYI